jgi:DNA-binding transcriptional MerR regulator
LNLKTGDVAICADTSVFTIREWSDWGLLGPVLRMEGSRYRLFDPRVVAVVCLWKTLRNLGMSPQQLREIGQSRTPETTRKLVPEFRGKLQAEIAHMQCSADMLQSFTDHIEEGQAARPDGIGVHTLPAQPISVCTLGQFGSASGGKTDETERQRWAIGQLRPQNKNACSPLGFAYNSFTDLLERQHQPAKFISYDPQGKDARPAGEYLVGTEHCCYEQMSAIPERMAEYAQRNGLEFTGPAYTTSLLGAESVTTREQFVYQAVIMVQGAGTALQQK